MFHLKRLKFHPAKKTYTVNIESFWKLQPFWVDEWSSLMGHDKSPTYCPSGVYCIVGHMPDLSEKGSQMFWREAQVCLPSQSKNNQALAKRCLRHDNTVSLEIYHSIILYRIGSILDPCMVYLPTFGWFLNVFIINVGNYAIHGSYEYTQWLAWDSRRSSPRSAGKETLITLSPLLTLVFPFLWETRKKHTVAITWIPGTTLLGTNISRYFWRWFSISPGRAMLVPWKGTLSQLPNHSWTLELNCETYPNQKRSLEDLVSFWSLYLNFMVYMSTWHHFKTWAANQIRYVGTLFVGESLAQSYLERYC